MSTQGRDPRIERVIVQACRRIHSRSVRARVALELTNHLEEAIAAKKESGLAQEAALSEAIAEFGDLGEVSATLARVHRPIYLSAPFLATAAMCALLITGAYLQTWANAWLRFMDDDLIQSIEKYRGVFLEDEKVLSADPLFGIAGTKSDAGRFLNDRVSWCGDPGICKAPYSSLNRPSRIRISPEAIKQLSGWRESWPQHAADLPDLDTSWMRELSRFDHWDLFVHGPLAEIYRSVPERVTAWAFPIPSFYGLRYVARARLLQGIRDGKLLVALREADQLGKLVYSAETQISSIVASQFLEDERIAVQYGIAHGLLKKSDWRAIPEGLPGRARRAFYAYSAMFQHYSDPSWMARLLSDPGTRAGLCGAINESLWSDAWSHAYLDGSLPLERDYTAGIAAVGENLPKTLGTCRLTFAHGAWEHPERVRFWYQQDLSADLVWFPLVTGYAARIPFVRQWIGASYGRQGRPGYFNVYEREAEKVGDGHK